MPGVCCWVDASGARWLVPSEHVAENSGYLRFSCLCRLASRQQQQVKATKPIQMRARQRLALLWFIPQVLVGMVCVGFGAALESLAVKHIVSGTIGVPDSVRSLS